MNTLANGSAAELLAELDTLGIQIKADGERLRFRPREKVTADLASRMKAHKAELMALVVKRAEVDRLVAQQFAALVPYRTADGRWIWVHPGFLERLDRLGLLWESNA